MGAVIRIDILGDSKSAQRSASDANRSYDRLGRGADSSGKKVKKLGSTFATASKSFAGALGVTLGATALLAFGKNAIRAASDVQQSFGALDAVFGKNSAAVKSWANSAANDVGLAKSEYAQLAVVTGSMLKNTGIKDFSGETKKLITLGADLAAQFGGSTSQAVEAIGSLLRGETDPIEKYGVSIKQSAINSVLAKEGLDKLTGSALTQAQQQARLKLLFDQTSAAQGTFGRESGTLANQQQKLGAKWENLSATIGTKFLPIATKVVTWLSDTLSGSNGASKALQRIGAIYKSELAPILESGRAAWTKINKAVNDATGSNDGFKKILDKVLVAASKLAPIVGKTLAKQIEVMGDAITIAVKVVDKLWKGFQKVKSWADKVIGPIEKVASALDKLNPSKLAKKGLGAIGGLLSSGVSLPGGLGRAGGGVVFAGGFSPAISVGGPTVQIFIDGKQLDQRSYSIARKASKDEIASQVLAKRRIGSFT